MTLPVGMTYPQRRVVRTGVSPMNPKVKYAELQCGHDIYLPRKPRIGSLVTCDKCPKEIPTGDKT